MERQHRTASSPGMMQTFVPQAYGDHKHQGWSPRLVGVSSVLCNLVFAVFVVTVIASFAVLEFDHSLFGVVLVSALLFISYVFFVLLFSLFLER